MRFHHEMLRSVLCMYSSPFLQLVCAECGLCADCGLCAECGLVQIAATYMYCTCIQRCIWAIYTQCIFGFQLQFEQLYVCTYNMYICNFYQYRCRYCMYILLCVLDSVPPEHSTTMKGKSILSSLGDRDVSSESCVCLPIRAVRVYHIMYVVHCVMNECAF